MKTIISGRFSALSSALLWCALFLASAAIAEEPVQYQSPVAQVDINTADAETLAMALDGIGVTRARDIVTYREEHGEFQSVEELQRVNGIGEATVERNRERIVIHPASQ